MEHLAVWAATGLAAKILADVLRRAYGFDQPGFITSARRSIETDLAYGIAYGVALLVVNTVGLEAALLVCVVLRAAALVGDRVVLPGNHSFLELYLAAVCLRLHDDPVALAAVLQVAATAVWVLAAYQKVYQREYLNGTYYYLTLRTEQWRLGRWTSFVKEVPPVTGDFGRVDADALRFCRWMGLMVLVGETVPPLLAFALNGTVWSVLLLVGVALAVGLSSKESNFMITNLLLAGVFLVPFSASAFGSALRDPVVAAVVGLCAVWPVIHAALARGLRVSSWKLAGWGMYAMIKPHTQVVLPGGELAQLRGAIPARIVLEFGPCRIGWVRDAVLRYFFRWDFTQPATGLCFRWHRLRGDRYVTHAVVVHNVAGAPARTFDIVDEASAEAFRRHLAALPLATEAAPLGQPAVATAVAGG